MISKFKILVRKAACKITVAPFAFHPAASLIDREADMALFMGQHGRAERLSFRAASLREGRAR